MSTSPRPAERQAVVADGIANDLHQGAGSQLRQMTQVGQQPVVRGNGEHARFRPQGSCERRQLFDRLAGSISDRRQQPRPAREEIRPGVLESALRARRRADGRRRK